MGRWLQRLTLSSGVTGMPRRALRMIGAMALLSAVISVVAPIASTGSPRIPAALPAVVAIVIIAHLAGMRMRIGSGTVHVAWGEAAVIIGFTLLPAAWMPAAVGLGILIGTALLSFWRDKRSPIECVRASSALSISVGLAAIVVSWSGFRPDADLNAGAAITLAVAAVVYHLCTALFYGLHVSLRDGGSAFEVAWSALRGVPIMIVGNLALGLLASVLWRSEVEGERILLLVLLPLLWLMHQLYSHRLREDRERRTWQAFATASRSLHRLDEVTVAHEGMQAALVLFDVREIELAVLSSGIRYRMDVGSSKVEAFPLEDVVPELPGQVSRLLEVAGGPVGSLALVPVRLAAWGGNDQHRLAAFADALAAALHDAATHSALRDLAERTDYESSHDPLTRLLNRDALLERGHILLRDCPPDQPVALILLDMDNFKAVNDTLGHLAGDELLQRTAARLAGDREGDELMARLGGDEFALLLTDLPGDGPQAIEAATAVALRRARSVTAMLAAPIEVAGVTLSAEISAGVVVATAGPVGLIELLRRADIALYQAKESGVRTMVYQAGRDDTSTDRLALAAELRGALSAADQLTLVLQPAVELDTGVPIGVEALIRWQHPRRGPLTPVHFVRAVEASDLLGQFTRYVLDRALAVAAELAEAGNDLSVSVNLSPRSLLDAQLPADLAELLRKHRVPAYRLTLEITETVVLSPLRVTDQVLHSLRSLGVRFAVDDFGTGYSSLTFLTRIAVDELKVDRTFVAKMGESKETAAIVRAVVDLGQRLGIRVVAEGVETAEQRAALVELGCDAGQGFHFGRAVPENEVVAEIHRLRQAVRPVRAVRAKKIS